MSIASLKIERITSGNCEPTPFDWAGIENRIFVSHSCLASGFSTGTYSIPASNGLAFHSRDVSEALTVLAGEAYLTVEDRQYKLQPFDSAHIPANIPHSLRNASGNASLLVHWAIATEQPSFRLCDSSDNQTQRLENSSPENPEHISRFDSCEIYELSPGAHFRDLFSGRIGSVGICGGYGRFQPGASLPCHFHEYDESITIVEGDAECLVQGKRYQLSNYDTAFVPVGKPHRFINQSNKPMAMIWVYAGSDPERTLVNADYCNGLLPWTEASKLQPIGLKTIP